MVKNASTKAEKTRTDQLRKLAMNVEGISLAGGRADGPSRDKDSDIIFTLVWRIRARIKDKGRGRERKRRQGRDDVWSFHSFTAEYL